MTKVFLNSNFLASFIKKEQDEVITNLCKELSCEPSSVEFLFKQGDLDIEALEIPRG